MLWLFVFGCTGFFFTAFTASVSAGYSIGAFIIWLASPGLLYAMRFTLERGWMPRGETKSVRGTWVGTWRTVSWSFIVGDMVGLTLAAMILGSAWDNMPVGPNHWYSSWWWAPMCLMLGFVAGGLFHNALDGPVYEKAGWGLALKSPSKLVHDFVAYPVLFGGLLYLAVPVLLEGYWGHFLFALFLGVGIWVVCVVLDARKQLDVRVTHPRWSEGRFRIIQ